MGWPEEHRFASNAIRSGATQELSQTGYALEVIKCSGDWACGGSRSCVDMGADRAVITPRLVIGGFFFFFFF